MITVDTILVGYDGSSPAQAAVDWAIAEARRWEWGVRLVDVVEWPVRVGPATRRPDNWPKTQAYRDAEWALDRTVDALVDANPDVPIDGLVVEGPPAAMLSDLSTGVRLVVVGDRGREGFAGLLLGSVATAVAHHSSCTVAVVRGRPAPGPVVVGVDDTPQGRAAVSVAFAEAIARDAELAAVRAWQPSRARPGPARPHYDEMVAAERALLTDLLADDRRAEPGVTVTTHLPQTDPVRALIEASRGAQVVVVGSGPTVRPLLRHTECPVLVVRPPEEASSGPRRDSVGHLLRGH